MKFKLLIILIFIAPKSWAGELEERVNRALELLDRVQAEFRQTVLDENKKVVQQARGQVSISRPGKFAWIYQEPYEQQIIADGKELWVYDVDLDQATVRPVEQALGTAPIMVLMTDQRVEKQFDVAEIGQRKFLFWVELTPKQADMEFTTVYIGIQDDQIKAMELRDAFGQSTQIVFENLRSGMIFDPATFRFEAPPGVDVFGADG
jgi:outer membrane lipoprotein carrier protein